MSVALLALRYFATQAPVHQQDVAGLDGLLALIIVCYLVAPSAEQGMKMLAMAWALRSGVQFRSSASAQNDRGKVTSTLSAGRTPSGSSGPLASARPDPQDPANRPREDG